MKANQNFRNADDAVSPVIGVILMVAITVVLAAVVFVLVSDLGEGGESAPAISFDKNDGTDRLIVVKAESGLNWDDFQMRLTTDAAADVCYDVSTDAVGDAGANDGVCGAANSVGGETGDLDNTAIYEDIETAALTAGTFLDFCGEGAAVSVTVQIQHTATNSIIYNEPFDLVAC